MQKIDKFSATGTETDKSIDIRKARIKN